MLYKYGPRILPVGCVVNLTCVVVTAESASTATTVHEEGNLSRKHEMESVTKRAHNRYGQTAHRAL